MKTALDCVDKTCKAIIIETLVISGVLNWKLVWLHTFAIGCFAIVENIARALNAALKRN
jgi:hypothetical protein